MGVKDLWSFLAPIKQNISIDDLSGKTIAVDLSCWVCEGQFVGEKSGASQPRMYLRNLYFRTHALLMIDVKPVFVLDGKAPELKLDAMKQRNNYRYRHFKKKQPEDDGQDNSKKGGRSRFKGLLKQCKEMLELMGVICLESEGEAEALCGQLNRDGLVDGVITQDSDVFLYGARVVYRNLVIKTGSGTIEAYTMDDVEKNLKLNREKLVALSLLCGCDYDTGVKGVGIEMASKYLASIDGDALKRFQNLCTDAGLEKLEEEKNGCTRCCHRGKASEHKKNGCRDCFMSKNCTENSSPSVYKNLSEEEKKLVNFELILRRKVMTDDNFPNQEIINEFLHTEQILTDFDASWRKPNICRFVNFSSRMMEWEVEYGIDKIFPMLTRWILWHSTKFENEEIVAKEIVKKRILKGIDSFEICWRINDENLINFLAMIMDNAPDEFSSTEPQTLVSKSLPHLFEAFNSKTAKRKITKMPKKSKKAKINEDGLPKTPEKSKRSEISEENEPKTPEKSKKSEIGEENEPKTPKKSSPKPIIPQPVEIIDLSDDDSIPLPIKTTIEKPEVNFSLGLDSFCNITIHGDSDDDSDAASDISAIVDAIISRKRF